MIVRMLQNKTMRRYCDIMIGDVFKVTGHLFHKTECGPIYLDNGLLLKQSQLLELLNDGHGYVELVHGYFQQTEKPQLLQA